MNDNKLPIVAIVGRPNVGKSTLFNRLLSKKLAVAHETSGVTRDRNYHPLDWNGKSFVLVDTGGLTVLATDEKLSRSIRRQVDEAVIESDLILFMVDSHVGITTEDIAIARDLKRNSQKVILVANKADTSVFENNLYEFMPLGFGEPVPISAIHGRRSGDLLDIITNKLGDTGAHSKVDESIKLAVIGRPNVGKSTLINKILGSERMITDDSPGTTRDSIDSNIEWNSHKFTIIDTAGLRKRSHVSEPIEYMSTLHTRQSIERCDVALVLVEAAPQIDEQDVKIIQEVRDNGKGLFIGMNKWDLKEKESKTFDTLVKRLKDRFACTNNLPVLSLSAKTGQRVDKVLETAHKIYKNFDKPYAPQDFKEFLLGLTANHHHPAVNGKRIVFYSMTLTSRRPLVFEIRANHPLDIRDSYVRYIENQFYERFDIQGIPMHFKFLKKTR